MKYIAKFALAGALQLYLTTTAVTLAIALAISLFLPASLVDILVFPLAGITGAGLGLYIIPPLILGALAIRPYVLTGNRTSVTADTFVQMKDH